MKMIFKIAKMELQKMFYSPIAWLILIIFAIQSGILYMSLINELVTFIELSYGNPDNLTAKIFTGASGFFNRIQPNLYLYIPLLTMSLMSKEFDTGSIKLLYSAPITNSQIVLGKFFSMLFFSFVMVLILFLVSLYGFVGIKEYDFPLVLTGLFGLYLLICTYSAIGLFMSSLTSYQVVAAMGTFATLFVLQQIGSMWQTIDFVRDITYWLSISGRSNTFIEGLICSEDVLYFILVSALFITFTIFRLKGIREISPKYVSFTRYTGAFMVVALLGYSSTIPFLMKYHDATRTNTNTLTVSSQEIISKLKGKVTITTYVNVFDIYYTYASPENINFDREIFSRYMRFYPNIKLEYKYYYALPTQEAALKDLKERYPNKTTIQILDNLCKTYELDIDKVKPAAEYSKEFDLPSELNRFVRNITTEGGKSTPLRVYDDPFVLPDESQISAAFKHLVSKLPLVGFVKGQEERDINDLGERGYSNLSKDKTFRYSLKNNGFDFMECELSKPIDTKINILVIAEAKTLFSAPEMKNLNDYIDRGGNLIIAADRKRQPTMNPLVERFGVTFLPGQIVEHNKGYPMDLITSDVTKEGQQIAYRFENITKIKACVTMPGVVAISYKPKNDFKYTPVLTSDVVKNLKQIATLGSWNELQTTDFIDDVAQYNPESGETASALTTALALTRKVGTKDQKIMILGDADCLSNGELSRQRNNISASNFDLVNGMFFWMSENQVPIDVRRPTPPDDKLYTKDTDIPYLNTLYKIMIPGLFALAFLFIWLRRKGR